jgi:hypothetical protein
MAFMQRWGYIVKYTSAVLAVLLIIMGLAFITGHWKMVTGMLG